MEGLQIKINARCVQKQIALAGTFEIVIYWIQNNNLDTVYYNLPLVYKHAKTGVIAEYGSPYQNVAC